MSRPLLALLTIGQSPRPDMTEAIVQALPPGVRTIEAGVLDGLSAQEISRDFRVRDGAFPLISRLTGGDTVALDEAAVERGLQRAIDRMEAQGADVIAVLCTGHFASLRARRAWLVEPDRIVLSAVRNLARGKRLGLVAPLPGQVAQIRDKWSMSGDVPACTCASPYGPTESLVAAASALRDQGAQAIVLDCMGYGQRHKGAIVEALPSMPVFVSAGVLAAALGQLL